MHNFTGKVHLLDEPNDAHDASVAVDLNRIVIRVSDAEIGSWPHPDVDIVRKSDGIHLAADGEVLVLDLENSGFFLDLMGVNDSKPARRRRPRRKRTTAMQDPPPPPADESRTGRADEDAATDLFDGLGTGAADNPDDDEKLHNLLAIGLGIALALVLLGAALNWGAARLLDPGSFPVARVLAGFGALAGLVGLYLAFFDRQRINGSAVAIAAGVVVLGIAYLYARAAQLKMGFALTVMGGVGLVVAGAIGLTQYGSAARQDDAED